MKRVSHLLPILGMLLTALILSGCNGMPVKPPPSIKEVPVPVPCVKQRPAKPTFVHDTLDATFSLDVLYSTALADLQRYKLYTIDLETEVEACATIPKQ